MLIFRKTYTTVDIILLRLLIKLAGLPSPMDHAAMHRYSLLKDGFNQSLALCMPHGIDPSFGECEVD